MFRFPPKVVGILCTLQVLAIIAAVMICRAMLKYYNTALVPNFGDMPERFNWVLNAFLLTGSWFLLVPLAWGTIATCRADLEARVPHVTPALTKVGYGVTLFVLAFCVLASLQAMLVAFGPIPMSRMRWIDLRVG